jgi:hypothetical protein
MKTEAEGFLSRFGSESFTPVVISEAPPNLNTGRNRKICGWYVQTDIPDELSGVLAFSGPEPPASLFNERLTTVGHRITFDACKQ